MDDRSSVTHVRGLVACVLLWGVISWGWAATIYVDTGDDLQNVINAADDGDEVVLDTGTYAQTISFNGKAITIRSWYPDNPQIVAGTILDGNGTGTVVTFGNGETAGSVLRGLTIEDGDGVALGGGIVCVNASPTISGNRILNNQGQLGGGIYCSLRPTDSPTIIGNTIGGNVGYQAGGGIMISGGAPVISGNTITGNQAPSNIGANGNGGGIECQNHASPDISHNVIANNTARLSGGGICMLSADNASLSHNTILDNVAETVDGGGIYFDGAFLTMLGNVLAGNTSTTGNGGGLCLAAGTANVMSCTLSGNSAGSHGGGIYGHPYLITNTIIAFCLNGGIYKVGPGAIAVGYCDVYGNTVGNYLNMANPTGSAGNISANPLFAATSDDDYHLKSRGGRWWPASASWVLDDVSSPCIDAGDPTGAFADEPAPNGGRINMGAYGNTDEASKTGQRPPTEPTAVAVTPANPRTPDDLVGAASGSTDPDGDAVTYQYQWATRTSEGDWGPWLTQYGAVFPASATVKDSLYKVRARATDLPDTAPAGGAGGRWFEDRYSAWVESAAVRVLDSAPTAPSSVSIRPPAPRPNDDLTANATGSTDADDELVEYRYEWTCSNDGGATWEAWGYAGKVLTVATVRGQLWKTHARSWANGVTSAWVEGLPVTVGDGYPTPPGEVTITPTAPTTNHDLRAAATGATDPDGDECTYIYQWNVSTDGGLTWGNWPYNGRILPAALTSTGEMWKAQARALSGDPTLRSAWVQSAPVTIVPPPTARGPLALTAAAATTPAGLTEINVTLSAAADLSVRILNLAGREVAVLPERTLPAGTQTLLWDGRSMAGTAVVPGQYLVRLEARQVGGAQARTLVPLRW